MSQAVSKTVVINYLEGLNPSTCAKLEKDLGPGGTAPVLHAGID